MQLSSVRALPAPVGAAAYGIKNIDIYGPVCIGVLLSAFGCGVLLAQVASYILSNAHERIGIKILLLLLLSLNIAQSACDCSRLVKILVLNPDDLIYFISFHKRPEEIIAPALNVVICFIVQLFFLDRSVKFLTLSVAPSQRTTGSFRLKLFGAGAVLVLGILLTLGAGLGVVVSLNDLENYIYAYKGFSPHGTFPTMTTLWLSASAATDIALSAVIIFALRLANLKGRKAGGSMVRSLVRLAAQSGLLITALQILCLILYQVSDTAWSDFPAIFVSKVYSSTLLFALSLPRDIARTRSKPSSADSPRQSLPIPLTTPRHTTPWNFGHIAVPKPAFLESRAAAQTFGPDQALKVPGSTSRLTSERTTFGGQAATVDEEDSEGLITSVPEAGPAVSAFGDSSGTVVSEELFWQKEKSSRLDVVIDSRR